MLDPKQIGPHTFKAAQWATDLSYDDIPSDVIAFAKRSILDGFGCSVRGTLMQAGRFILKYGGTLCGSFAGSQAAESTIYSSGTS